MKCAVFLLYLLSDLDCFLYLDSPTCIIFLYLDRFNARLFVFVGAIIGPVTSPFCPSVSCHTQFDNAEEEDGSNQAEGWEKS
jgi:hypothetical protein